MYFCTSKASKLSRERAEEAAALNEDRGVAGGEPLATRSAPSRSAPTPRALHCRPRPRRIVRLGTQVLRRILQVLSLLALLTSDTSINM